ncbi:hypothetical protein N7457_004646 [Penicillium paradoxum]|uniref:uncharacterized protein n=1 Tax=Penicillium paradoxum TaxID=176176 RepID=UPI0025486B4B|nr:uncharacterized protein N7457_004646 [Penicillium paradoxum]KAJ5782872.1 hypothetical protein N7457_004646 [Penicillium paradoxum]
MLKWKRLGKRLPRLRPMSLTKDFKSSAQIPSFTHRLTAHPITREVSKAIIDIDTDAFMSEIPCKRPPVFKPSLTSIEEEGPYVFKYQMNDSQLPGTPHRRLRRQRAIENFRELIANGFAESSPSTTGSFTDTTSSTDTHLTLLADFMGYDIESIN